MKSLSEMTHYEVLEVGRETEGADLERAYRMARAAFAEDGLASYEACPPEEAAAMRERIELAYRVLSDPDARQGYDATLGSTPDDAVPIEFGLDPASDEDIAPPEVEPEIAGFDDLEDAEDVAFDGARLRRARLRHGFDIERIAQVTKINPTYLRLIEEEEFEDLPASVYVRGFVSAFARCVGLDAERVVPAYMDRFLAARPPAAGGRRGQAHASRQA